MSGLRRRIFLTAGSNVGVLEETAVGSIWLGSVGNEHGHVLLTKENAEQLIQLLQHFVVTRRLPE